MCGGRGGEEGTAFFWLRILHHGGKPSNSIK
jgi:hypothetical protein